MDKEPTVQQKAARFASPLVEERSPKRLRTSLEAEDKERAMKVVDIIEGGDALLVVSRLSTLTDTKVGLRVSSFAMSMASTVFKAKFATAAESREEEPKAVLQLTEADGDAAFIVCNILHLRNDELPARVSADQLLKVTLFAETYSCKIAVGRSTAQWFDHLYHGPTTASQADLCKLVEAAFLLDEAAWFARFTSRWVLASSMLAAQPPNMHTIASLKLALTLMSQHTSSAIRLRRDLDSLVDVAARCFSLEYKHYIDWAPEMSPDESETPSGKPPVRCRVDGDGGQEFLGALRQAHIWPSDVWFSRGEDNVSMSAEEADQLSIGDVVDRLAQFALPEYNDADRCEFCDDIKTEFAAALKGTKQTQKERLWGLCLDCFKAGGVNGGECRFEHPKQHQVSTALQKSEAIGEASEQVQQKAQETGGLGIEGL